VVPEYYPVLCTHRIGLLHCNAPNTEMHHSRLCAGLIDCKTSDVDEAARFWGEALGHAVDPNHPNSRGNYRMLETPPDEPIVEIQRVDHESRVLDIETDHIPAEVARLEKLGAKVVSRLRRWVVMDSSCTILIRRPARTDRGQQTRHRPLVHKTPPPRLSRGG
jgi:hypothetical protein